MAEDTYACQYSGSLHMIQRHTKITAFWDTKRCRQFGRNGDFDLWGKCPLLSLHKGAKRTSYITIHGRRTM